MASRRSDIRRLASEVTETGLAAPEVMWRRLALIGTGSPRARAEVQRMVSEKFLAAFEAANAFSSAGPSPVRRAIASGWSPIEHGFAGVKPRSQLQRFGRIPDRFPRT